VKLHAPILMYHHVGDPPPGSTNPALYVPEKKFAGQMEMMAAGGWSTMGLGELAGILSGRAHRSRRRFVVTFDDGFADGLSAAAPILERHGFAATFFVCSGAAGRKIAWERSKETVPCPTLAWKQMRELAARGHSIGGHTRSHVRLGDLSPDRVREEIVSDKRAIEENLGAGIDSFCYPYGDYSPEAAAAAREAGYLAAVSNRRGNRHEPQDLYCLRRITVFRSLGAARLNLRLGLLYHVEHALRGD